MNVASTTRSGGGAQPRGPRPGSPRPSPATQGAVTVRRDLPDLRLLVASHTPDTSLGWHAHALPNVAVVLSGSLCERVRGAGHQMGSHDAVFKPAGERHCNTYGPAGACTLLLEMCAPEGQPSLPPRPLVLRGERPWRLASHLYRELAGGGRSSRALLEDLSWSLVALFVTDRGPRPSTHAWLVRVKERLGDEWPDPPTVAELAAEERVHPTHLIRAFGRAFGTSPGGYVRELRARRALDAIVRTSSPLSRVAAECGFADQSHLCREITRRFGEPPSALRRRAAPDLRGG